MQTEKIFLDLSNSGVELKITSKVSVFHPIVGIRLYRKAWKIRIFQVPETLIRRSMVNTFFKLIYFNCKLITFQYCSGFCHTLTWISHGCTCVPHPETPSHLPPHPIPQDHPSAQALGTLSHALNLDRWSISPMVIYMFQCYSLK